MRATRSSAAAVALRIRPARPEDAARIRDLHVASIREAASSHYTRAQIAAWSDGRKPSHYRLWMRDGMAMWIAERSGRIAGFAASRGGELHLLFVHPRQMGRGVGSALLAAVERQALREGERQLLCPASLNAVRFYRGRGFRTVGRNSLSRGGVRIPYVDMRKTL